MAMTENTDDASIRSDIVFLTENLKQIRIKACVFEELDDKIIAGTEEEEKLKQAVFEAADLKASLSEKMAVIQHTLQTFSETVMQLLLHTLTLSPNKKRFRNLR